MQHRSSRRIGAQSLVIRDDKVVLRFSYDIPQGTSFNRSESAEGVHTIIVKIDINPISRALKKKEMHSGYSWSDFAESQLIDLGPEITWSLKNIRLKIHVRRGRNN